MALLHRSRRPVSQSRSRTSMLVIGFLGVAVACLLAYIGFNAPNAIPGRSYYNLRAEFTEADNLTSHYQVRIRGRLVGQVLHPRVEDGKGVVDLQLEPGLEPLRADTRLRVRPRSPIGVRFVDLVPGTKGDPLPEGGTIRASQTSSSTQLDTVLATLDPATRGRTQALLAGLSGGFAARGEDINETIGASSGFLVDTRRVMRAIADNDRAVQTLIRGAHGAATAADPVRGTIASGFAPEADAAAAFGRSRPEIEALLDVAPSALPAVRADLAQASPLLQETSRFAREVLPLLEAAPDSLRATTLLFRDARSATRALSDTLDTAQDAVDPTLALLDTVDPVLPGLREGLRAPAPLLTELAPRRCDVIQMLRNWESMLAWGQAGGNYLRFDVHGDLESFNGVPAAGVDAIPYPRPCEKLKEGPR